MRTQVFSDNGHCNEELTAEDTDKPPQKTDNIAMGSSKLRENDYYELYSKSISHKASKRGRWMGIAANGHKAEGSPSADSTLPKHQHHRQSEATRKGPFGIHLVGFFCTLGSVLFN